MNRVMEILNRLFENCFPENCATHKMSAIYLNVISNEILCGTKEIKDLTEYEMKKLKREIDFFKWQVGTLNERKERLEEFLLAEGYRRNYTGWRKVFNRGSNFRSSTET